MMPGPFANVRLLATDKAKFDRFWAEILSRGGPKLAQHELGHLLVVFAAEKGFVDYAIALHAPPSRGGVV